MFYRLCVVAASASALRVTVLGGTGYVGSRVCEKLVSKGHDVTSVSKSGSKPDGAWADKVTFVANDLTRGPREGLEAAVGAPDVCVSCVGTVGFDGRGLEVGNGVANVRAAEALAKTALQRYVYVSVASEVAAAKGWLPDYFGFYFAAKDDAEKAIAGAVGEANAYFVKPSFIYGGDSFGLFPPRVASGYGSAIEELLSGGARDRRRGFRGFADATRPRGRRRARRAAAASVTRPVRAGLHHARGRAPRTPRRRVPTAGQRRRRRGLSGDIRPGLELRQRFDRIFGRFTQRAVTFGSHTGRRGRRAPGARRVLRERARWYGGDQRRRRRARRDRTHGLHRDVQGQLGRTHVQ